MVGLVKGQVALEYVLTTAFLLLVIGIVFYISMINYSETIALSKAQNAVKTISAGAEYVYALGPGNVVFVSIDLPSGLSAGIANENNVEYTLEVRGRTGEIYWISDANIANVSLPTREGPHELKIEMNESQVSITEV
jgi:uncharacterized protein (UPF0333 family)